MTELPKSIAKGPDLSTYTSAIQTWDWGNIRLPKIVGCCHLHPAHPLVSSPCIDQYKRTLKLEKKKRSSEKGRASESEDVRPESSHSTDEPSLDELVSRHCLPHQIPARPSGAQSGFAWAFATCASKKEVFRNNEQGRLIPIRSMILPSPF